MSGMASFLTGLGGGYIQAKDKQYERDRQAKEDAFRDEQRSRQRKEWTAADQLNADLKDAATPRATMQGTVTEAGGNKYLNADPAQAKAMQDTLAAEAEMTGAPAPTQQAGTGVVAASGTMARGNQITTEPVDVDKLNAPQARNDRVLGALQKNGQIERAMSMENTMLDQQAKRLGLDVAQAKFADDQFNRKLTERLSGPEWAPEAAKLLTETQVGALAGVTVVPRVTADGKSVEFVGASDGKERVLATFENSDAGRAKFLQQTARAPLETKISWIVEDGKAAQEQSRWQQTFDLTKQKEENDQQYRARTLAIQQAQEGRARATHAATLENDKIPPGVKLQAASLAKQVENIGTALNKAMAEGQFDPNNPGTARLLEQQTALNLKYSRLIQPYIPGQAGAADPLGLASPGQPAASTAPAPAATAPATVPRPPARPAPPPFQAPPTMEQIQAQTRANREQIAQRVEAERRAAADPAIQALNAQRAQALWAGNAVEANAIMARISEVKQQRYGVQ